ncbi:MAG: hypothetical protein AAF752_08295, partial [Bacteroidota bacterium]
MRRLLAFLLLAGLATAPALAQNSITSDYRGQQSFIARGVLDGNLIETNFRNQTELARWSDLPWGVWPRGIGGRHIDGIGLMVAGVVPGERESLANIVPEWGGRGDTLLNPVITHYRSAGTRIGSNNRIWG